jgi:hypothetical protein
MTTALIALTLNLAVVSAKLDTITRAPIAQVFL